RDGRSSVSQVFNTSEVETFEFLVLKQKIEHRRYQHRVRDPLAFDCFAEGLWTELWNRALKSAESRRRKSKRKVSDVEQRRRVKIYATFFVWQPVIYVIYIGENVCVSQRHAFRQTSRAAGIDQREDCVRIINRIRSRIVVRNVQRLLIEYQFLRNLHCRH